MNAVISSSSKLTKINVHFLPRTQKQDKVSAGEHIGAFIIQPDIFFKGWWTGGVDIGLNQVSTNECWQYTVNGQLFATCPLSFFQFCFAAAKGPKKVNEGPRTIRERDTSVIDLQQVFWTIMLVEAAQCRLHTGFLSFSLSSSPKCWFMNCATAESEHQCTKHRAG